MLGDQLLQCSDKQAGNATQVWPWPPFRVNINNTMIHSFFRDGPLMSMINGVDELEMACRRKASGHAPEGAPSTRVSTASQRARDCLAKKHLGLPFFFSAALLTQGIASFADVHWQSLAAKGLL